MDPLLRILVLLLVLLPIGSACIVAFCGRAARRAALLLAIVHLGITAALVVSALPVIQVRTIHEAGTEFRVARFAPAFVPGDAGIRGDSTAPSRHTAWTLLKLPGTTPLYADSGPNVQFYLGIDGLNLWLVVLCSIMLVPAILVSWTSVKEKPGAFFAWLFLLQASAIGAFLSFDIILFYVFFESTLIPSFFLIGRWGVGSGRREAARKFFLYTLAGSLLTLVGIVGVVITNPLPVHPASGSAVNTPIVRVQTPNSVSPWEWARAEAGAITFSIPDLMGNVQIWADGANSARQVVVQAERELAVEQARPKVNSEHVRAAEYRLAGAKRLAREAEATQLRSLDIQFWVFLALIAGFMVKIPVFPFHTWLPSAYGQSSLGVTILLSALLAKLGTFGILRLVLPLTPDAALAYGLPAIGTLAAFQIVYGSLCAFGQREIKLLVAYSSIAHLGFLVLGLFAFSAEGLSGAVLHMVNHGITTGALFALLSFLIVRYNTTDMRLYGGLIGRFPIYSLFMFTICFASIGLPGLNNFVSEMLMLGGLFHARNPGIHHLGLAFIATFSILLSVWYILTMLQRVFFSPLREPPPVVVGETPKDVTGRELFTFALLAGLCLMLGLFPQLLLDSMKSDVHVLTTIGDAARARATGG